MVRSLVAPLAVLTLAAVGCASTPVDSDPTCAPCPSYFADSDPEVCPYEPYSGSFDGPYTNLVFEGGGVKGTAYGGSIAVLEGSGLLADIDQVAGTSAGALTSLLVALGYSAERIHQIIMGVKYEKFRDGSFPADVARLFEDYGWYKGDYALCLLECIVEMKTGDKKTTFAELHAMRADHPEVRDLYVFGTDVNQQATVEFSHQSHPDVPLADAARISMSIPFYFAARVYQGDVYVDGGVLRNYPIDTFDESEPLDETLGFFLGTEPSRASFDNFIDFSEGVVATLLDQQVANLCDGTRPQDVERSVFIPTCGIGTTDFSITPQQKCELIRSGRTATIEYLEGKTRSDKCPPPFLPIDGVLPEPPPCPPAPAASDR